MDALAAVLSLTAAIPINPGASRRRRRLQESIQECHDGHDGFLVELSPTALPSPALRAKALSVGAEIAQELSVEAIAVRASDAAIDDLLADNEIRAVTANCIVKPADAQGGRRGLVGSKDMGSMGSKPNYPPPNPPPPSLPAYPYDYDVQEPRATAV